MRDQARPNTLEDDMGKVSIFAAVSLDGFIAADDDTVGPLFDWYQNGDVAGTFSDEERVFHTTAATADFLYSFAPRIAAGVLGRRLFDLTNGWNGVPANGEHCFVVTHRPPTDWPYLETAPFTFVTDGVRSAIEQAKAFAGDRDVSVSAGEIGGQALREGLIDQVVLNLVPAVLGSGRRFFGEGALADPILFDDPRVVEGRQVTHLVYDLRR
jgi:dihydrofolate reductase